MAELLHVRRVRLLLSATALLLAVAAFRTPTGVAVAPAGRPAAELSVGDALVLGLVEGVTEYLPISSTGHLIIATRALRLDSSTPLLGPDGTRRWLRHPSARDPAGVPLTLKLAADTYTVVIQFGAIAAVALLYWPQLLEMFFGMLGRDPAGRHLLVNLVVAFLPAAVLGLLLNHWIDRELFSVKAVVVSQISGAALMIAAERWRRKYATSAGAVLTTAALPTRRAFGIGCMQCLALWPGMSRSMTTIVGGYFAGFEPRLAAEFSFLLGLVTLTAATVFKGWQSGPAMIAVFGWPHVLLGALVATVAAALSVKFLIHYLTRHGLTAFAWYRVALALVLAVLYLR